MPVWGALLSVLGWNYARSRRGKPTLCSSGRKVISPTAFAIGWGVLTGWLVPHFTKKEQ